MGILTLKCGCSYQGFLNKFETLPEIVLKYLSDSFDAIVLSVMETMLEKIAFKDIYLKYKLKRTNINYNALMMLQNIMKYYKHHPIY